jgi:hypothetical protein
MKPKDEMVALHKPSFKATLAGVEPLCFKSL